MTKFLMTCAALLLLAACASQPATSGATAAPDAGTSTGAVIATAAQPQQSKLICQDSEQIGSHFRSRVCLTPEQVEARRKAAQAMFEQGGQTNPCGNNPCGGGGPPR